MSAALGRALDWNGPLVTLLGAALALAGGLLLAWLPPLGGALLLGLAVLGLATVLEPLIGLVAALFLGLLRAYLATWVAQVPDQIGQAFVLLALAAWLARGLAHREVRLPGLPGARALLLPLSIFIGAALLSLWGVAEWAAYAIPELIKWVQMLLLILLVRDRLAPRRLGWLAGALLLIGLFQAGVGVWQFGLRGDEVDPIAVLAGRFYGWKPSALQRAWVSWIEPFAIMGGRFYRAYGTFEQPNVYGGYMAMTLSLGVGLVAAGVQDRLRGWRRGSARGERPSGSPAPLLTAGLLLAAGAALAMLAALGMSWSRGAWIGFAAAAGAMALALPRRTGWGLLLAALLVVGAVGLYASGLLPAAVTERLTGFVEDLRFEDVRGVPITPASYAVLERLAHWQAALEMFRHHPWTGVGLGCYEPAYPAFALINWPIPLGHAHNFYLNVAAETGVIGLAAYLLLWGAVVWQTWRVARRAQGLQRGLAIGLLGAWTHLCVHHLFDNLYVNNLHLLIGLLLGLLAVIQLSPPSATEAGLEEL